MSSSSVGQEADRSSAEIPGRNRNTNSHSQTRPSALSPQNELILRIFFFGSLALLGHALLREQAVRLRHQVAFHGQLLTPELQPPSSLLAQLLHPLSYLDPFRLASLQTVVREQLLAPVGTSSSSTAGLLARLSPHLHLPAHELYRQFQSEFSAVAPAEFLWLLLIGSLVLIPTVLWLIDLLSACLPGWLLRRHTQLILPLGYLLTELAENSAFFVVLCFLPHQVPWAAELFGWALTAKWGMAILNLCVVLLSVLSLPCRWLIEDIQSDARPPPNRLMLRPAKQD
jgi:hypothetical protein